MKKYNFSEFTTAEEIRKCRKKLGYTQQEFADFVGVSKPTVERWEAGKKNVTGPIALLVELLLADDTWMSEREIPERKYPIRLSYMFYNRICTIIDVDELKQSVKIKNFTKNIMFCAFGANNEPTFADYEDFLRSRCFPETRDKIKIELDALGIPFYDPMMIIEKTEGRMAEDDFWIKIEK